MTMSNVTRVEKGWGHELWVHNSPLYCGKLLVFNANKKFSMHYHKLKHETWYVNKGEFVYSWIDLANGELHTKFIKVGDVVTIPQYHPHQLHALEDGEIFEVSTQHFDSDSYRIWKGD
jgi:mannose-6-phosphate isomerase-like protein (cupin superfamily)